MSGENRCRRIVFTGGPGFGKSSVLNILAGEGYSCMPEAPRQLILEQRELDGGILPGNDFTGFADLVVERMVFHHQSAESGLVLFDRGLPDINAYLRHAGYAVSTGTLETVDAHPYDSPVFFFPDWKEIYNLDGVRYETFEQARDIGLLIRDSYKSLGYRVIEVPKYKTGQRASFVREFLA